MTDIREGPHLFIPAEAVGVLGLPAPPEGMEIIGADLIVRVRKIEPK
jgi:hypothetical protein